ncbi:MAG TPA: SDR family oxidoreductase [Pilimelia sp.]|nr:SDR family oxidoreductase [Pilimelia sp.]
MIDDAPVALVTGASSGIGRATALALVERGYRTAVLARRRQRLEGLAEPAGDGARHLFVLAADVAGEAAPAAAVDTVVERWGRLDVVVAAAGHGRGYGEIDAAEHRHWSGQLATNLRAPMLLAAHALPHLRRTAGHLIFIGSVFAAVAAPGYAAYAASKHGLTGFVRSIQREPVARAVRISLIHPGTTDTEFSAATLGAADPQRLPERDWPFRPLAADDVAAAVMWVLSRPAHVMVEEITLRAVEDR